MDGLEWTGACLDTDKLGRERVWGIRVGGGGMMGGVGESSW